MARTKLLLGVLALGAAAVFLKRDKVAALLPSRSETPSYTPPAPGPSNYDAPGPVANTATPVPAPEPHQPPTIDEAAEEAAAAAEAANIGGAVSDYAGPTDLSATEAERPLAESGEGSQEGLEQAEDDLRHATEPTEQTGWDPPKTEEPASFEATAAEDDTQEQQREKKDEEGENKDEEGQQKLEEIDWRTWSGRSIDP
jgi:hypothetical protein